MYGPKIKHLQNMGLLLGSWCSLATAKLLIFSQHILWESCSKWYFKHFLHSMYCRNIFSLAALISWFCHDFLSKKKLLTQAHWELQICIENKKFKNRKTWSPAELKCSGDHVFKNANFFIFFLICNSQWSKCFFQKIEK